MPSRVRPSFEPLEGKALLSATPGLTTILATDRSIYVSGEPVRMTMVETNTSNQDVDIGISALSGTFTITQGSKVVWTDVPQVIPQFVSSLTLHPGQSYVATATWNGVPDPGYSGLMSGTFEVNGDPSATFQILTGPAPVGPAPLLPLSPYPSGTTSGVSTGAGSVAALYEQILGRAPDPAGLAAANQALASGATYAQLANALIHSAEYDADLVASYYKGFLGRNGSSAEISSWVSLLQTGMSPKQVALDFVGSAEYQALHASSADYIQALYRDFLGRYAQEPELANWQNSGLSRATIAAEIANSTEAETDAIQNLYSTILGRPADSPGLSSFLTSIQGGRSNLVNVAVAILDSPEAKRRDL